MSVKYFPHPHHILAFVIYKKIWGIKMSNVLNIAICEDEIEQKNKLIKLLNESSIKNTYSIFSNGEELLEVFETYKYDLILMNIYMDSELTGIKTVKLIRKKDKDIPVAFVTTSKDHALESYRLSAMKYIEKSSGRGRAWRTRAADPSTDQPRESSRRVSRPERAAVAVLIGFSFHGLGCVWGACGSGWDKCNKYRHFT